MEDSRSPILACGNYKSSIRAEGGASDLGLMAQRLSDRFASSGLPQPGRYRLNLQ